MYVLTLLIKLKLFNLGTQHCYSLRISQYVALCKYYMYSFDISVELEL